MDTSPTIVAAALTGIGSILASVITGYVAGRLGVRRALEQFRFQRGFERQLDWYETTTQALFEFWRWNDAIVFALKNDRSLLKEPIENTKRTVKEFLKTLNNSLLYADVKMYLRLKEIGANLGQITEATNESLQNRTDTDTTRLYEANGKLLEQTIFELSKPIREKLGLDELSLADFEK